MVEPKKVIYGVGIHGDKGKKKVMKAISSIIGVESIDVDLNEQKLTVIGIFDPIRGYDKLKKVCVTNLLFLDKKEEPKKEEPKKEEPKTEDEKNQNGSNKMWTYEPHFNPYLPERYCVIMEDNPKCCVIS